MICSLCGGTVVWMGPLIALTHTQCRDCGGMNCQEPEYSPWADDEPEEQKEEPGL